MTGHEGPTPSQTREVIHNLVEALGIIANSASDGGPETLTAARSFAEEALRSMPRRYMPDDIPEGGDS